MLLSPQMSELLARLGRLDSCAVSDALDKLGLKGAVAGIHRMSTDRRISGRVLTVKLVAGDGRAVASRHLGAAAIDSAKPGDVIVIEQSSGIDAAGWGGTLSLGASLRGVAGVIIEGPARDVDESAQHNFPVFARDHTSRTAHGRIVEAGTNVPITVGEFTATPGGLVGPDGRCLGYGATRAREVDFGAPFVVMLNSYLVKAGSPIRSTADVDRAGVTVAAVKGQTQELFVSRSLKHANVRVLPTMPAQAEVERLLAAGEVDAFAINRQRSLEAEAASDAKLRALRDSFLEVHQVFVVTKASRARLDAIE